MREKLQTKAFEIVGPVLQPGEQPVAAVRTSVGKFSSSRAGTVLKKGLVMEGVGGVGAAVLMARKEQFVVLTDRRLIFLQQTMLGGPGKKVLGEVPRHQVSLVEAQIGLFTLLRLAFGNQGDGVALTFPRQDKRNAEALAAALGHRPGPA
ncbi:hypothetical protein [Cryptosporangium arvum]|uniref:hypothetical protein n=1 Tax=Cryptosporangium arvum TaxID=80871 RepID=UPI0004BB5556|nr:hypothetical protein [Cryptosporangium arvum]